MAKYYTIASAKPIPCLDNIVGPLTTPVRIEHDDVMWMLNHGYEIYEHNPVNKSEKVLVTRQNANGANFKTNRATATSRRLLNRSIQDMEKPIVAEVIRKSDNDKKKNQYQNDKNNQPKVVVEEVKKEEKPKDENAKVSKPDNFSK